MEILHKTCKAFQNPTHQCVTRASGSLGNYHIYPHLPRRTYPDLPTPHKPHPKVTPPLGVSLHTAHRATHGNGRPRPDWSSHFALVRYVGGREGWFLTLVNSAGTFLESLEFHENPSDSKKAPALLTSVKNQPSQNHENPTLRVLVQDSRHCGHTRAHTGAV